jgi:5'-nucleotidase
VGWTLITNDDGIESPGLHALAEAALAAGHRVVVAAPAEQASGAGTAITTTQRDGRVAISRRELPGLADVPVFAVAAQPAFIAFAAANGWFPEPPSLVLSGINAGANLGVAVMHSGTVGAALTAGRFGVRALAVSLDCDFTEPGERRWDAATALLPPVLGALTDAPAGTVLTLNVPNADPAGLGPPRPATLAERGLIATRVDDPRHDSVRVRLVRREGPIEPGSDAALLAAGHPTLTALRSVGEDRELPLAALLRRSTP